MKSVPSAIRFLRSAVFLAAFSAVAAAGLPDIANAKSHQDNASVSACEKQAVDKHGKKLTGAARASFLKRCEAAAQASGKSPAKDSCEARAIGKNGRKLAGAARASFLKKCRADASKK